MKTIYKLVLKSYLGPMVLTFFIIMFVLMMNVLWRYIDELSAKDSIPVRSSNCSATPRST